MTTRRVRPPSTILLGALIATNAFATDICLPVLPDIARHFAVPASVTQLILSSFALGFGIGQAICGPLADYIGRKPVIISGIAIFIVAGLGCWWTDSISAIIMFRFIQGCGASVGPVVGRVVVFDIFDSKEAAKKLSHMMLIMAIAPLCAPTLGSYLSTHGGWRCLFLTLSVFGIVLMISVSRNLTETLDKSEATEWRFSRYLGSLRDLTGNSRSVSYLLINCFMFSGLFIYISCIADVCNKYYNISDVHIGIVIATPMIALIAAGVINGYIVTKYGHVISIQIGFLSAGAGGVMAVCGAVFGMGIGFMLASVALYLLGLAFIQPNALAIAIKPHIRAAGMASSVAGCSQMTFAAITSGIVVIFDDDIRLTMSLALIASVVAAYVCFYFVSARRTSIDMVELTGERTT